MSCKFKKIKRCLGYDTGIQNFHSRFPHQVLDYEPDLVKFVISNGKLHS